MFYNCSSLSSLPDISKWKTDKVNEVLLMFAKCTSLISLPDLSEWNTKSPWEMRCLFSDCTLLLYLPDISNWDNYNENDLYEKPDYERIKKFLNFSSDIQLSSSSPDKDESFNNHEFLAKQIGDKIEKFLF